MPRVHRRGPWSGEVRAVKLTLESPVVHQITEQRGSARGYTIIAKCGATYSRPAGELKPGEFTIWGCDVTCEACKP